MLLLLLFAFSIGAAAGPFLPVLIWVLLFPGAGFLSSLLLLLLTGLGPKPCEHAGGFVWFGFVMIIRSFWLLDLKFCRSLWQCFWLGFLLLLLFLFVSGQSICVPWGNLSVLVMLGLCSDGFAPSPLFCAIIQATVRQTTPVCDSTVMGNLPCSQWITANEPGGL